LAAGRARNGTGFPLTLPKVRAVRRRTAPTPPERDGGPVGPLSWQDYPEVVMASRLAIGDSSRMQVLSPRRGRRPQAATLAQVIVGGFVGAALLVSGVALGWLAFATPLLRSIDMPVRATPGQIAVGATAWAFALTAPAACVLMGLARLAGTTEKIARMRRRPGTVSASRKLGKGYVAAANVRLPDGRSIPEIVIGPHGVAIVQPGPPSAATRHHGSRWEVRLDGRWVPLENPLERATRDLEAVRRWLGADDQDFVVRVHTALVTSDASLERTPTCAVISPDQVSAWLTALPPQRSLSESRQARLIELVREAV
jgi:hypothetical protein